MKIKLLPFIILFSFLFGCSSNRELVISPRTAWTAAEPRPYKTHIPERITIHHEGTRFEKGGDAPKHIKNVQTWGMGKDRNWTDIPYHFLISPDGVVYEGRNVFTVGETATEYNPEGHLLITLMGNFEEQEVSAEQLEALIKLTAYCCEKYNINPETIASHKDYSAQTACPGKNLYDNYIKTGYVKKEVEGLLTN